MINDKRVGILPFKNGEELSSLKSELSERRLHVSNLNPEWSDDKLKEIFSAYGEIDYAYFIKNRKTNKSRRFGYVFTKSKEVSKRLTELGKIEYEGFQIEVRKHVEQVRWWNVKSSNSDSKSQN